MLKDDFLKSYPVRHFEGYGARVLPEGILAKLRSGGGGDRAYMNRLAELGYAEEQEEE